MDNETTTPEVLKEATAPVVTSTSDSKEMSYPHQISKGVIIGMIVFGVILITAIYVSTSGLTAPAPTPVPEASTLVADTATASFEVQGTSDEVDAIEEDLNSTDFNSLEDINKI